MANYYTKILVGLLSVLHHNNNTNFVILFLQLKGFFLSANDETRKNVNGLIKEAISSTIKLEDENLVIELLEFLHTDKKIKTLTDTTELTDDAILHATVQQRSETLTIILKWIQNNRNKKFNHRNKSYNPNQGQKEITLEIFIFRHLMQVLYNTDFHPTLSLNPFKKWSCKSSFRKGLLKRSAFLYAVLLQLLKIIGRDF